MSQTFGDWDATASNNTTVGASAINIAEGCPPGNVNDALREIMAAAVRSWGGMHAGTSRPAGVQAGRFWLDTTNATAPVIKWFDGTDDIPFATIDYSTNKITLGSSVAVTLADNSVTFAKLQDIATSRILGRVTSGTGDPEELTGAQVTALLDVFTSAAKGLVPASGGGTTNFLRADGNWAAPYSAWTESFTSTVTALNVLLPIDSTAPTTSEGVEVASISGVSVGAGQKVEIQWDISAYASDQPLAIAIFRGTTCICARVVDGYSAPDSIFSNIGHYLDSPSSGTYTYSLRAGPAASTTDVRLNAVDSSGTAAPSSCVKSGMRLRVVG